MVQLLAKHNCTAIVAKLLPQTKQHDNSFSGICLYVCLCLYKCTFIFGLQEIWVKFVYESQWVVVKVMAAKKN